MKSIIEYIEKNLSPKRLRHTYGVCDTAVALAKQYGADPGKAYTAALFHDMYKGISQETLAALVDRYGLEEKYKGNLNLAHSKLAAAVMEREYGITDRELLDAVSFHTTGRAGMSLLEKILYIADATEPGRDYPGVEELRMLARQDIDKACLAACEHTLQYLESLHKAIDEDSTEARDDFKKGELYESK